MLSVFLLVVYSRVLEVVWGDAHHIPLITGAVAIFLALFGGQLRDTISHSITQLFALFSIWFMLCIPFAYWRRGSLAVLNERWGKSLMVFFAIAALVVSVNQLRRLCLYLMGAVTLAAFLAIPYGTVLEGRLEMSRGELANSNQLAMVALMGIPLCLAILMDHTWAKWIRLISFGSMILLVTTILRTGSRTGLLSLMILGVVLFLRLPMAGRFVIGVAAFVTFLGVTLFLPTQVVARLASTFSDDDAVESMADVEARNSSRESTENRMQVLREGIEYTLERPIFGLGPGNFVERRNDEYHKRYGHQGYLASHNSYVQVSSEMGIPGFLLFIGILGLMYRVAARVYKKFKRATAGVDLQLKHLSFGMGLMILMLAVFCFFNHIAYDLYIPTIAGLLVVMERVARKQQQAAEGGAVVATPQAVRVAPAAPALSPPAQPMARPAGHYRLRG